MVKPSTIYVDDSDSNIVYGNGWFFQTQSTLASPAGGFPPLYGTLHSANVSTEFSYTYSGTDVFVSLWTNYTRLDWNCTVDGQLISPTSIEIPGDSSTLIFGCNSRGALTRLQDGQHNLHVRVAGNSSTQAQFDYLSYIPSQNITSGDLQYDVSVDGVTYTTGEVTSFGEPGAIFDFNFTGYSISLIGQWASYTVGVANNTPGFYTIDENKPINFTLSIANASDFVLIQSPSFPLAHHHLHVEMLGPVATMPTFTSVIVQHSTSHFPLDPIPALPSNSTSTTSSSAPPPSTPPPSTVPSVTPSSSTRNLGIIVGIPTSVIVILLALLSLFLWRKRTSRSSPHNSTAVVDPFDCHETGGPNTNVTKSEREGKALDVPVRASPPDLTESAENSLPVPVANPSLPRVIFHHDSGRQVPQPESLTEVVEYPPTYDSLGVLVNAEVETPNPTNL